MSTNPETAAWVKRTVDEQFLALICSDEELLQAEFDAITAEEWPVTPAPLPPREATGRKPKRGRWGRWQSTARVHPDQNVPLRGQARRRQRSPPALTSPHRDRKVGDRHT